MVETYRKILLSLLRYTYRKDLMPDPHMLTKEQYVMAYLPTLRMCICYPDIKEREKVLADAWIIYKFYEAKEKAKKESTKQQTTP